METGNTQANVEPTLTTRDSQPCVAIPITASFREWNKTINAIPELFQWIQANNVIPAGPLFYRYIVLGDMEQEFQLEIGIATTEKVTGDSNVQSGEIPGGTYATHIHHGHPDQLVQVYAGMEAWARDQEVEFDIDQSGGTERWVGRYEFYLTNPEDEPDPSKWQTEIAWKIKDES